MKNLINLLLILFAASLQAQSLTALISSADDFLQKNVEDGMIDYAKLKQNPGEIDRLYGMVGDIDISRLSEDELLAFYINAYNLIVIHQVIEYYPLKSALDRSGFFNKVDHNVGGQQLTLDQLEKGKVILKYRDPRVHFAFSCAAKGCPEIAPYAYKPDQIDSQLDTRTRKAVNNPEFTRIDYQGKTAQLSKIFDWYKSDFGGSKEGIITFLNKYQEQPISKDFTIEYYPYNWELNEL